MLTARLWVDNVIRSLKTGLEVGESCIFISINYRHMGGGVGHDRGGDGILLLN